MSTPWLSNVSSIADGEPVNQGVTNRALRQLTQRTQHLKELAEASAPQSGRITYSGALLTEGVTNGSWVYFNEDSGIHDLALFTLGEDTGSLAAPSAASIVLGVVISAANLNSATILVAGAAVTPVDVGVSSWQDMCVSTEVFAPGLYFLSDTEAGKMTRSAGTSSILLGWFGDDVAKILPQYNDPLVQHRHDSFVLSNRPASYSRFPSAFSSAGFTPDFSTGDWTCWFTNYWSTGELPSSSVPDVDGDVSLDFYREVQLSTKFSRFTMPDSPVRVTITPLNNPVDSLTIAVNSFDSGDDPDTAGALLSTDTIDLPDWGEWIEVPEAGMSFSLVSVAKEAARYDSPIAGVLDDAADSGGCWYVFVDTTDERSSCYGWTNANPFDTPGDAVPRYRYIHELDAGLDDYYPSTAFENWTLAVNGLVGHPDELRPYGSLLSWGVGTTGPKSTIVAPFAVDLPPDSALDPQSLSSDEVEALWSTGILYSANPLARGSLAVVSKLIARCPAIKITGWNNDTEASRGELGLGFDPVISDATEGSEALSGWDPTTGTFSKTTTVSRVRAGHSILVEKVDEDGVALEDQTGPHTGPLKISVSSDSVGGEISLVALENAKESRTGPHTYIEFVSPTEATSAATARVTVPADLAGLTGTVGISFSGLFFGKEDNVSGVAQQAIFKIQAWILRKGISMDVAESRIEAWKVAIPIGYAGMDLLSATLPVDGATVAKVPAVVHSVSGISGGDIVVIRITRSDNDPEFTVSQLPSGTVANGYGSATYDGSVGMLSLSWSLYEVE